VNQSGPWNFLLISPLKKKILPEFIGNNKKFFINKEIINGVIEKCFLSISFSKNKIITSLYQPQQSFKFSKNYLCVHF